MAQEAASPEPAPAQPLGLRDTFRAAGDSFRDRNFSRYFWSNALFFLSQGIILLGAQWLLTDLTGSRTVLGQLPHGPRRGAPTLPARSRPRPPEERKPLTSH